MASVATYIKNLDKKLKPPGTRGDARRTVALPKNTRVI
jgi:hypothetical protein